ncbi:MULTISPECIES: hypothetical protein [unclassified Jeotgalibaca]|uniref:hypothetical protein n=1 Tax=unclassified Jeotgalibaca TaxID=2621505 RepID=UPI003FD2134E
MNEKNELFSRRINRLGRLTSMIALFFMLLVPFGTAYYYGTDFKFSEVFAASIGLIATFLPTAVVENISYYPVFGAGAMYLSSITGNILNMKLPAVVSGHKIANVEPGSDKGDVIAIISVGISSLVTIAILILGNFVVGEILAPLLSNPVLKPGFDNITPALLGAITLPQLFKAKKLTITPIIIALGAYLFIGPENFGAVQSYVLISVMALSVGVAYLLHKRGLLDS